VLQIVPQEVAYGVAALDLMLDVGKLVLGDRVGGGDAAQSGDALADLVDVLGRLLDVLFEQMVKADERLRALGQPVMLAILVEGDAEGALVVVELQGCVCARDSEPL